MYHMKLVKLLPGKADESKERWKKVAKIAENYEDIEFVGLYYPRGSGYNLAFVTKCKDYGAWEKFWKSPEFSEIRPKIQPASAEEKDWFFEERKL